MTHSLTPQDAAARCSDILNEIGTVVVGMDATLKLALGAVLAGGHVLFEDLPGLGKTLAAKTMAQALGLGFRRLQCTPDLLPSDVTGSSVFDPATRSFNFIAGPVFTNLLLADEINRTSPKTQSALLEAMAEAQVSVEGRTIALEQPFHVFATANPIEFEGTYPLPEAQLDRFLIRVDVGYPEVSDEQAIIRRRLERGTEGASVRTVVQPDELLELRRTTNRIEVDADVVDYAVRLTAATRSHDAVDVGASPRGSQALVLLGRALALMSGRDFVLPEDVKFAAKPVLAHRLTLTPGSWARGVRAEDIVAELVNRVATPTTASAHER